MIAFNTTLLGLAIAITLATAVSALNNRVKHDDLCAEICVAPIGIAEHAPRRIH